MKARTVLAILAIITPMAILAAACGDETTRIESTGNGDLHGITVTGEGKVTVPPDVAVITLGVTTLAPTVAEARDSAAASLDAMITSMKNAGVAEKDIQTQQLSIYPEYNYRDGTQELRGFRVTNTVTAKIREIDKTGAIVDGAVTAGGNNATIQSIAFTIDDPASLREQARSAAVEDARGRAETLAEAAGVKVGGPLNITETGVSVPVPYAADRGAAGAETETPIEPGELDVVVNVTVTWAID